MTTMTTMKISAVPATRAASTTMAGPWPLPPDS